MVHHDVENPEARLYSSGVETGGRGGGREGAMQCSISITMQYQYYNAVSLAMQYQMKTKWKILK